MDTKLKSRVGILLWLVLFTYGISGMFAALFDDHDFFKRSYFETSRFENQVENLLRYIYSFEIIYKTKEELIESLTVSEEEVEEYRSHYGDYSEQIRNIEFEYESRIAEAENEDNQEALDRLMEERDQKIQELKILENDEYIIAEILKEKKKNIDQYYKELENHRAEYEQYTSTFVYNLKNTSSGRVYSNLPANEFNEKNMHFKRSYPSSNRSYLNLYQHPLVHTYVKEIFDRQVEENENALYEGQIGISKSIPNSNFIMRDYHDFNQQRILFWIYTVGALIALIASIMIEKRSKILRRLVPEEWQHLYNKIPIDVAVILFVITFMFSIAISFEGSYIYYYSNQLRGMLEIIFFNLMGITIILGLTIIQGIYLYRRLKDFTAIREDWANSLFAKVLRTFKNAFSNRRVGTQVFLILIFVFFIGTSLGLTGADDDFIALFFLSFFIVGLPMFFIILRKVAYFNQILKYAKALANGNFEPDLKVKGKSVLAKLANDLNQMKSGVKASQNEQAKSERLKTELITNVSHDLRTPLTSIMTYSELLKNPELPEDERQSYVEIIDRKSQRLKVLIDDLFEASKMASGAIELEKKKVDINELLHQALAEYNETIEQSSIQFRVLTPDQPVYANVDGPKVWRVFENLIGNILNYSQDHTRAYIQVVQEQGQAIISFKNISKYELSDDIEELFERFKRGDKSRHTEGSGLGLAISKSIIDLHDGTLDIDVDADLFKVTIKLDLVESRK